MSISEESITCYKCHGIGKITVTKYDSRLQSSSCRICKFQALGKTQVEDFQQHDGMCRECRGEPYGYEKVERKLELCKYCNKPFSQH